MGCNRIHTGDWEFYPHLIFLGIGKCQQNIKVAIGEKLGDSRGKQGKGDNTLSRRLSSFVVV